MAKQSKNTLYGWAVRGWKPLAQQVRDWYDSFWHKDDAIPIANIDGLAELLNTLPSPAALTAINERLNGQPVQISDGSSYNIPNTNILEKIVVLPTQDMALKIGSGEALEDILPELPLTANKPEVILLNLYANGDNPIYFSGLTIETTIIFYKR